MPQSTERRRSPRVRPSKRIPMQLALPGAVADARVHDISTSGVRCFTDRAFPLMTQVGLVLVLPAITAELRRITCQGAVVRSEPSVGSDGAFDTAIFFTSMGDSDKVELEGFVELLTRSEPEQSAE